MFFKKIPKNIKEYHVKSILIIGLGSLGDNLMLTPTIKLIKDTYKKAEIDIVIGPRALGFARNNPWFSNIYVWNKKISLNLFTSLRKKRYDIIFDFKNSLLPFFLRGKYKFTFFIKEFFSDKSFTHESERTIKFVESYFGKPENINLYFPVLQTDIEKTEKFFKTFGINKSDIIIVMNPGAAFPAKRWKKENFIQTGKEILKIYDAKIIITGNKLEKSLGEDIKIGINNKNVFNLAGETTIGELAAILKMADVLITNDTGTLHLASAVRCPVVVIFGPSNPYRYGPIGTKNYVLHADIDCFPCKLEAKCNKKFICMEYIYVKDVINAVSILLNEEKQLHLFEFE
ncbi:MAG: glycosyltransferase family 9 protein [Candidatus Omnitrophica bacterium]|jgi:lipopolysaccharide heptosyltransferase II|nr:glycosyltransferase family 9 protein [Candidatus Omnitrophota bacterium]